MRRLIIFFIIFFILIFQMNIASEWGILEIKTEVLSKEGISAQKYDFLLERWWSDSLGISMNIFYENFWKYRLGFQSSYLRSVYGYFYPNLNYYTKYLNFKGLFLGIYILNDEIYLLKGRHIDGEKDMTTLGWQRPITPRNLVNFSISSYDKDYFLDINLLQQHPLPLGNCFTSQEISLLMKEGGIYISGILKGEVSLGNFSLKGYIGSNHSQNFDLCDIKPGEFGGELYLRAPITSKLMSSYSLGYFHNFQWGVGRLKLGNSIEWQISDFLNLESYSNLNYSLKGEYDFSQTLKFNFPAMEGALVGSIYWSYERTKTLLDDTESNALGLKISYQF